jgi:uncharacterized membrane protein
MAKFGVGVGEEFPVDEPPQGEPNPRNSERSCGWHRHDHGGRFGWLHVTLHVLFRLAIIALVIAAAWALFRPHNFAYAPYGFYPYHHHFFFPFFPVLLIALVFFFARRHWRHHHHWHDHHRGRDREDA